MRVLGLVVEYNPFHTGHLYHINKAKEMVNPDVTIVIMSGNFVQRGEVAIIDKFKRSEIAIKHGIDLVIELPFVYVNQSADYFCHGAIRLLNEIGCTDIVFGSENGDIEVFKDIAITIENNQEQYNNLIKENMNNGLRYPDACNQALSSLMNKTVTTPNDLLGLGYVKEVINHHYPINIDCFKRTNDYHDLDLDKISSASSLRVALKKHQDVSTYLLNEDYYQELSFNDDFFEILRYRILLSTNEQLKRIHLVDEGIENLLIKNILEYDNMNDFVDSLTSRRYTKPRIQRMLINVLMDNSKQEINNCLDVDYLRVLKMNDTGRNYLNKIKKDLNFKLVTTYSSYQHPSLSLELKAAKLLACLHNDLDIIKKEYRNIPFRNND